MAQCRSQRNSVCTSQACGISSPRVLMGIASHEYSIWIHWFWSPRDFVVCTMYMFYYPVYIYCENSTFHLALFNCHTLIPWSYCQQQDSQLISLNPCFEWNRAQGCSGIQKGSGNAHLESTSPAAVADGPSADCRRSLALCCCQRWEAVWRSALSSFCF